MTPRYSLDRVEVAFPPSHAAANTKETTAEVVLLLGAKPAHIANCTGLPDMNAAAHAGVQKRNWFDDLSADDKSLCLSEVAKHPGVIALADRTRELWLSYLLAFADAEYRGVVNAREIAKAWSETSARFDERSFNRDYDSYKPRPGGITVATLLNEASRAGFDLAPWRQLASAANGTSVATTVVLPGVTASGSNVVPGNVQAIPRGAPITQMPNTMRPAEAEVQLNARLCKIVDWGGKPSFGRFEADGTVTPLKPEDLNVLLAEHFVATDDGKGGSKHISAAVWWVQSQTKTVYDVLRYDPEGRQGRPGELVLNTWRGFAIHPAKGSWRKMRRHIWKVICDADPKAFKFFVRWMAHLVQHPGTNPEVMVVVRSDREGVGKSSVGKWLLRIFGKHGRELADTDQIFGSFNDALAGVSFVLLEEPVFPGDHRAAGMLKAMITAQTLRINPKNRPAYEIPHVIHFMMTTNGEWAVPAGHDARRFLMLDAKREVMPRSYFDELWAEAEGGGIAAMLHDLLTLDLRGFNPRSVPTTSALIEQQRRSADDVTQWITDAVINGKLVPDDPAGGFGGTFASSALHRAYLDWCTAHGKRRPKTGQLFGKALGQLGLARGAGNNPPMWVVPDRATLLAAANKRAGIKRLTP
jgi:hypothetical protein